MEKSRPALVNIDDQKIVSAVAGGMHTVCLTNKGEVYTFGCNDEGLWEGIHQKKAQRPSLVRLTSWGGASNCRREIATPLC